MQQGANTSDVALVQEARSVIENLRTVLCRSDDVSTGASVGAVEDVSIVIPLELPDYHNVRVSSLPWLKPGMKHVLL